MEVDSDKEWNQNGSIRDGYDSVLIELGIFPGTAADYKKGLYDCILFKLGEHIALNHFLLKKKFPH